MYKKCVFLISLTILMSFFVCCGCGNKSQNSEMDVAKKLLNVIFSISNEDLNALNEAKSEEAITEWMNRYQEYMTEDGIRSGMRNRALTRGAMLKKDGVDTSDIAIILNEREKADEGWYNYEIRLSDDTITGSMHITDGKCDKIIIN